jgi:hypothetical protein
MEISIDFNKVPSKGDVIWAIRLPFHCGIYEDDDSMQGKRIQRKSKPQ